MTNAQHLLALTHHRYAIPAIAELWKAEGCKLVTLIYRSGSSEGAMKQTLAYLIEQEWAMRNPGYGHPHRPEYILTETGTKFGKVCTDAVELARKQMAQDVAFDKWSLPVLHTILVGARRHKEIRAALPTITPRALSQALANLEAAGWIEKVMLSLHPVKIEYRPTSQGELWTEPLQHLVEMFLTTNFA